MEKSKEVERIFQDEVRDKKRVGNNIHARTGKRGYVGKMLLPTDLMSRKEKYNHRKAGKVESYNMFQTILHKDEFLRKDIETQKMLLTKWRDVYPNKEIMEQMGLTSSSTFHQLIMDLDIPKKQYKTPRKAKAPAQEQAPQDLVEKKDIQESVQQSPMNVITNGLHLEYNGIFDSEQLSKIFTKLQLLTEGEETKFSLSISLTERE